MLDRLHNYKENKLLISQDHPELPITIWNYSKTTEFERKWDDVTTICRGLVTDNETGAIVARPFKKFWNIEEKKHTSTKDFDVFEKMDGSLGILFNYKGEWVVSSRGSFTSDQAVKARELLKGNDFSNFDKEYTYLFEIIYPENKIVVNYGKYEGLILLGAIHTESGNEMEYLELESKRGSLDIVSKFDGYSDYNMLKDIISDNAEGFVIRFTNGDRMKIKGEEYFRLHKIMTMVSTKSVWEYMRNGTDIDELLDNVPDEFYDKIKDYMGQLKYAHYDLSEYIGKKFDNILENHNQDLPDRKKFAEITKHEKNGVRGVLWKMYENRPYDDIIWRLIQPEFKKL